MDVASALRPDDWWSSVLPERRGDSAQAEAPGRRDVQECPGAPVSGVLHNGVQYEHCDNCRAMGSNRMVPIGSLLYEEPSIIYPYGRDICRECAPKFRVRKPMFQYLYK